MLVEVDLPDVEDASRHIARLMENGATAVLGHGIPVDVDIILPGENLRAEKGDAMWGIVRAALPQKDEPRK